MKKLLLLLALFSALVCAHAQAIDPGFGHYRNTALSSSPSAIKTSSATLFGFTLVNVNTSPVYVKFYNASVANTTVGTTIPVAVVAVPAGNGTTPGIAMFAPGTIPWLFTNAPLTVAAVAGLADNSTSAPSTAIYMEGQYK